MGTKNGKAKVKVERRKMNPKPEEAMVANTRTSAGQAEHSADENGAHCEVAAVT